MSLQVALREFRKSSNLLPSERLGIGGETTVRGYDERELNKDTGLIANLEFRFPPIPLFGYGKLKKIKDQLQFLVFYDYGVGTNHKAIGGEAKTQYLMGVGPGLRYIIGQYVNVRLDWGIRIHTAHPFDSGSLLHFSAIVNY